MIQKFNIHRIIRERAEQPSFHVFAEESVRVEFRNLQAKDRIARFAYEGDVIVTCYGGEFELETEDDIGILEGDEQALIPRGTSVAIACVEAGTLQIIWIPGHAPTRQ